LAPPSAPATDSKESLPPAEAAAPEAAGEKDGKAAKAPEQGPLGPLDFRKVPPVKPLPRPGYFPIPPGGEGYYSLEDACTGTVRKAPPKYPYPRFGLIQNSFFDVDWRYLDDPKNTEHDFWDCLKRIRFGHDDQFMATFGGDLRVRYTHETNSRLLNVGPQRFRGADNDYDIFRARVYGDFWWTNNFRLYVEGISALQMNNLLPPLPIDRNRADLLNAFIDARLLMLDDNPVWLRVGRQELLYGSQRLISPLEWADTRRTFQGIKAFYQSERNDLDVFLVQPILPNDKRFDSVDNNVVFGGIWYTHKPSKNELFDLYYLALDNTNPTNVGTRGVRGGKTVHTFGSRWVGDRNGFLWDVEGMLQTGTFSNQDLFAGAFTGGVGYQWGDHSWKPMVWAYYDYASGTNNPGQGSTNNTFDQLFPFGHYYLGWNDLVGRKNIHDVNFAMTLWPEKWITTQVQFHNFFLASRRDGLFGPGGVLERRDPTGRAGSYVGSEIDLILNFHINQHSDLLFAYAHLFAGRFIRDTATTPGGRRDPDAVYLQYSYRW
jgi:hypothetical protein